MFCGAGSFPHEEEDVRPASAPGKEQRKKNKNPYSTRGLDKFSAVKAELGARREKIMAKAGPEDVSIVKFMYDSSRNWIPIIVKKPPAPPPAAQPPVAHQQQQQEEVVEFVKDVAKKPEATEKRKESWWRRWRWLGWPEVVVVILLCLMVSGRVFAICCASVWWYLVANLQNRSFGTRRKLVRKKAF